MEPVEWIVAGVVIGLVAGGGYLIYQGILLLEERQNENEESGV